MISSSSSHGVAAPGRRRITVTGNRAGDSEAGRLTARGKPRLRPSGSPRLPVPLSAGRPGRPAPAPASAGPGCHWRPGSSLSSKALSGKVPGIWMMLTELELEVRRLGLSHCQPECLRPAAAASAARPGQSLGWCDLPLVTQPDGDGPRPPAPASQADNGSPSHESP